MPTIACVVCLLIGFVAGREQMRYQVANAMTEAFTHAFDGIGKSAAAAAPANGNSKPLPTPQAPVPVAKPALIAAKLLKKGFRDRDFSGSNYIKAAITFSVEFTNIDKKDIRAFDGVLAFNDLLGNRILGSRLTISEPIGVGQSITWDGELEYNQFETKHSTLRGYEAKDLGVTLQVGKVLFADGTQQDASG